MPSTIRVLLDPLSRDSRRRGVHVFGVNLRLGTKGAGQSQLDREQAKDALLVFHAGFLSKIRGAAAPSFEAFAQLAGTITRQGQAPVFTCPANAAVEHFADPSAQDAPPRELSVTLSSGFEKAPPVEALSLRLPAEPEDARYCEIGAELKIGGATEAGVEQNDLLDVPLLPLGRPFVVQIVDENDAPMADAEVTVSQAEQTILVAKTDGGGELKVQGHERGVPVSIDVPGRACLVLEGGLDRELGRVPDEVPQEEFEAIEGCDFTHGESELAQLEPPPDELLA